MRRYVGYAFLLVALLALIVWIISQFIQPLLPPNISASAVLFFVALLSVVGFLAAFKDTIELLHLFSGNSKIVAGNSISPSIAINEDSLLLYPYDNPPYNSVELHYVGQEQAIDLQVWKVFIDKDGVEQRILVNQFSPKGDLRMSWYHVPANVLTENDISFVFIW
jgi:hypothetical protein